VTANVRLTGMTWDHERGVAGLVAADHVLETEVGASVSWTARSLLAFGDQHVADLAADHDLLVIDHPHVAEAVERHALLPLDGAIDPRELALLAEQSVGASHASYAYEGRQWALAVDAAAQVSAFRPDLADGVPATWDAVLVEARAGGVLWPHKAVDAFSTYATLLAQLGAPLTASPEAVPDDTSRRALELMVELGALVPPACRDLDPIGAADLLADGSEHRIAVALFGYSNYSRMGFRQHLLRAADVPSFDGAGTGALLGGAGIAVSASSRHPDAAVRAARLLATAAVQIDPYGVAGGQPGNRIAWQDERLNALTDGFFRRTLHSLEAASVRPRVVGWPRYQLELSHVVRDCVLARRVDDRVLGVLRSLAEQHWGGRA
jgi:multiple sugar transport system substrate-binding protein